jgi:hypothetical protein
VLGRFILGFRFRRQFTQVLHDRILIDLADRANLLFAFLFEVRFILKFIFHLWQ